MIKLLKKVCAPTFGFVTLVFTIVPETTFGKLILIKNGPYELNIIVVRILTICIIFLISVIFYFIYLQFFQVAICIKGRNYSIRVEYNDIFNMHNCKKIIPFDACYTTEVGNLPADINPDSVCGQYLTRNPISSHEMRKLINRFNLKPEGKCDYKGKEEYKPGSLIPRNDFLLMAFAKLDKDGLGYFASKREFLDCLDFLWQQIDKYYGQSDICMPIVGSGVTRIGKTTYTQQELLDMIIDSYKLSDYKIKASCRLHIICIRQEGFNLNNIGECI